jgi:hypothetical protein
MIQEYVLFLVSRPTMHECLASFYCRCIPETNGIKAMIPTRLRMFDQTPVD